MRLKLSKNRADEELISLLNQGYQLLTHLKSDYLSKKSITKYNLNDLHSEHVAEVNKWGEAVIHTLRSIFPTELEENIFLNPTHNFGVIQADTPDDYKSGSLRARLDDLLKGLDSIRKDNLLRYTDMPTSIRLYIEDIDSFAKVRDVNPALVGGVLTQTGYFDQPENDIQNGLEKILNESFHKKDWGGEYNDLYSTNLMVNGSRKATAFLLKGNGLRVDTLEIKHCGKNGDQIVRLFESPADLFIVQFVGNVSEAVIKDVEGKTKLLQSSNSQARYCIVNGQDTARLFLAYSLIK